MDCLRTILYHALGTIIIVVIRKLRVKGEKRIVFGKIKQAFELCAVCTFIYYIIIHNIIVFI